MATKISPLVCVLFTVPVWVGFAAPIRSADNSVVFTFKGLVDQSRTPQFPLPIEAFSIEAPTNTEAFPDTFSMPSLDLGNAGMDIDLLVQEAAVGPAWTLGVGLMFTFPVAPS